MTDITIRDIAKRLEVSETAVSFAINNQPGISDATRSRILDEIKILNYKPRKSRSVNGVISLALSMQQNSENNNPIFSEIIRSIYSEAEKANYKIDIAYSPKGNLLSDIDLNKYDGLIILGTVMQEKDILPLLETGKPFVVMDNSFTHLPVNTVSIDNAGGMASAVNYLFENGHSRIGYIKSTLNMQNFLERYSEFVKTADRLGLTTGDIISVGISPVGAYAEMCQWLKCNKLNVSALIADNDFIALGAIRALREKGIIPGQDISIIGFDDLEYSHVSDPPLTTIKIFGKQLGVVSFKRLIEVMQDPEQTYSHTMIGTKLIIRDSVVRIYQ